jgi:hypothetical protein
MVNVVVVEIVNIANLRSLYYCDWMLLLLLMHGLTTLLCTWLHKRWCLILFHLRVFFLRFILC